MFKSEILMTISLMCFYNSIKETEILSNIDSGMSNEQFYTVITVTTY